jgi:hypothetical protein
LDFIETFNIFSGSKTNAFEQRSSSRDMAINNFISSPLFGKGFGKLNIRDAYIYLVLAEIGIVGFALFMLSFAELFVRLNIYSFAMAFGLISSMLGTDIPNMGFYYLCVLLVMYLLFEHNIVTKKIVLKRN